MKCREIHTHTHKLVVKVRVLELRPHRFYIKYTREITEIFKTNVKHYLISTVN